MRTDIDDVVDYVYPQQDFDPALQKYYDELRLVEKDRYFAATKLVEMMVNNLSSLDLVMKIAKNNVDSDRVDSRVRVAVDFINDNYASKITLAQLAEMSYVSENYFSKLFMRVMKQKRDGLHHVLPHRKGKGIFVANGHQDRQNLGDGRL